MRFLIALWGFITLKAWRDRQIRRRYEEIKALIIEQHLAGKGGLVVPKKYGPKDLKSFGVPMYYLARTEKNEPCIFWRKDLMAEEVGPPKVNPIMKALTKIQGNAPSGSD